MSTAATLTTSLPPSPSADRPVHRGTYYLYVRTDDGQTQSETTYGDNVNTNLLADRPELAALAGPGAQNLSVPASKHYNSPVNVSWIDTNSATATGTATGPWTDAIYYSTSSDGITGLNLLGTFTYTGSLTPGASSPQITQAVTLPANLGNLYIIVKTDIYQNQVNEGPNFTNNTTVSGPITLSQQPLPDLMVTNIVTPTSGVFSGSTVPITFTVTNHGTAPTTVPTWNDYVFMSQDNAITPSSTVESRTPTRHQQRDGAEQPFDPSCVNAEPDLSRRGPKLHDDGQLHDSGTLQGTWYTYVVQRPSPLRILPRCSAPPTTRWR